MFVLARDRAYLYGHPEHDLTAQEQAQYETALAQRLEGVPAQYITGHQEFWGMDLIVSPAVLIPRPETEHVIEAVLDRVGRALSLSKDRPLHLSKSRVEPALSLSKGRTFLSDKEPKPGRIVGQRASSPAELRIVDVGTGSGCIALAFAKELPNAEIHATDISPAALEVARANAARHQLDGRIHFHEADLLEGIERNAFDFVVSNPPYVGDSEEDSVQLDVRKFEPRSAVFAGPTGTEVIERLIPQAQEALKPGGSLVMEISGTIVQRVRDLLKPWSELQIANDLQGIPRVAMARKP